MASPNPQPVSSWFRRDASSSSSSSSIPQRNPSTRLPSLKLATPTASSLPIISASSHRPPTKLTKKIPEKPRLGPSGGSASVQQRVVPSVKSSGGAGLHRENNHGSESNCGPPLHPTKTRVPRIDAATTRTPPLAAASSLASGSSAASTQSSPRTALLRRKPSSIGRPSLRSRTVTEPSFMMHANGATSKALSSTTPEPYSDTVLGVAMPFSTQPPLSEERQHPPDSQSWDRTDPAGHAHTDFMEQERLNQLYASNRSQTTPAYALSVSPSTRYSESPGHFSHASSSTSMSSPSPGMVSRVRSRTRQISPVTVRPPLDRYKTDGSLLTVAAAADRRGHFARYESTNSSSSSSTVVGADHGRRERKAPTQKEEHPEAPNRRAAEKLANSKDKSQQAVPVSAPKQPSEQPIYPPPELAHLADANNKPQVSTPLSRPARPSREGTQDLSYFQRPSPVVQSNLTSLPTARHRRQISSGSASPGSFASRITSPQTSNGSKKPSISTNTASPNPSLPDSLLSPISTNESNIDERSRVFSPGNGTSRFGFFSRKSPALEHGSPSAVLRKEKRGLRKGPAAGTGHEGYGKYGIGRGRSISTNSLASSVGGSPSSESVTSNHAKQLTSRKGSDDNIRRKDNVAQQKETGMDDFLRERLQPVILRGEGSAGSSIATSSEAAVSTSSLSSGPAPRPATAPRNDSNTSLAATGSQRPSVDRSRPTLLPSSMTDNMRGKSPLRAFSGRHKRMVSHDSNLSVEVGPRYSNTTFGASGSKRVIISSPSADPNRGRLQKKEKDSPSRLNRKWNFFQRAQSVPKNSAPPPSTPSQQQMPFTVPSSMLPHRPVAHYEIDGAEERPVNIRELELMMEEVAQAADDSEKETSRAPSFQERKKSHDSVLLPPSPILRWPFESAETSPLTSPTVSRNLDSELLHSDAPRIDLTFPATTSFSELVKEIQVPRADSKDLGTTTGDGQTSHTESTQATPKVIPELMQAKSPREQLARRPSRLQQVGRIPHVVSTVDRRRNPNQSSFSRPFGSDLPSPALPPPKHALELPLGEEPREQNPQHPQTPPATSPPRDSIIPQPLFYNGSAIAKHDESALQPRTSGRSGSQLSEFLAFPRKYSELSHTSSSNAGTLSYALTPGPYIPPEEDEVWREYDDLIDEVMSSPDNRTPKSKEERKRANLTKDDVSGKFMERMSRRYSDEQTPTSGLHDSSRPGTAFEEHQDQDGKEQAEAPNPFASFADKVMEKASMHFEDSNVSPKTARPAQNPQTSVHLRRSQMLANFQPLAMLSTAGPASNVPPEASKEFNFADPEGRLSLPSMRLSLESAEPASGAPKLADPTTISSSKTTNCSSLQSQPLVPDAADVKDSENMDESAKPIANGTRYCDSRLMETAQDQNDGVVSMANLRVGALKTSKWLSFGRVLFSPAHADLENSNDERVLILDGLGKDWSYFCALTYPRTHFYYLSPAPSSSSQPSAPINPPPNYTHIHHSSASAPFPFPRGFFTAVVYRFPMAAPESAYRVMVGECKRVLRPGGYLELSAIDLDLVNMGPHARKVVRDLKWSMQNEEKEVCLANASDVLLRLVGRRGFEGIKRGVVGVPVSGSLKKSGGELDLGSSSNATTATADSSTAAASSTNPFVNLSSSQLTEPSFNTSPTSANTTPDMGFGPALCSTAPSSDDNMISRVGRWWYSRCYETSMFPRSSTKANTNATSANNAQSNGNDIEADTAAATATTGDAGVVSDEKTLFADATLLRECEERGTNFRLLICYAQKPEQARRRTVSV